MRSSGNQSEARGAIEPMPGWSGVLCILCLCFEGRGACVMTDACPSGYGVCVGDLSTSEVQGIARWDERWRFKRGISAQEGAIAKAFRDLDPYSDPHTFRTNEAKDDQACRDVIEDEEPLAYFSAEEPPWLFFGQGAPWLF